MTYEITETQKRIEKDCKVFYLILNSIKNAITSNEF